MGERYKTISKKISSHNIAHTLYPLMDELIAQGVLRETITTELSQHENADGSHTVTVSGRVPLEDDDG